MVGELNSTLACSIVARRLNIPVAHVKAGLRSGDMTMPEEINRRVSDLVHAGFLLPVFEVGDRGHDGAGEGVQAVGLGQVDDVQLWFRTEQYVWLRAVVVGRRDFGETQRRRGLVRGAPGGPLARTGYRQASPVMRSFNPKVVFDPMQIRQ